MSCQQVDALNNRGVNDVQITNKRQWENFQAAASLENAAFHRGEAAVAAAKFHPIGRCMPDFCFAQSCSSKTFRLLDYAPPVAQTRRRARSPIVVVYPTATTEYSQVFGVQKANAYIEQQRRI